MTVSELESAKEEEYILRQIYERKWNSKMSQNQQKR